MANDADEHDYREAESSSSTPAGGAGTATASQVETHLNQAATSAEHIADKTDNAGWSMLADEIKGLRKDIRGLVRESRKPATEESAASTPGNGATGEPQVEIEQPTPPTRKIRRNGRKVTRHA